MNLNQYIALNSKNTSIIIGWWLAVTLMVGQSTEFWALGVMHANTHVHRRPDGLVPWVARDPMIAYIL